MVNWINKFTEHEVSDLKEFRIENKNEDELNMAEEFEFNNGFCADPNADVFHDSSDDEEMQI